MSKRNKNKRKNMSNNGNQNTTGQGSSTVNQLKSIPEVMSCMLSHQVHSTTYKFSWGGEKLNRIWPEVLAFLKWTYDTTRSESQLRLFVNKNTKEWAAWAFPQKANLQMSAHELDERDEGYEKTKEQRAKFGDQDGWYYWGTVHHHCSTSAFQSGTDQQNERMQDGIHITVGKMDSAMYDIHFRVYVGGHKLDGVKLTEFWDVSEMVAAIPGYAKVLMRPGAEDELAKFMMCSPPPADTKFPDEWRANIIDCTPKQVERTTQQVTYPGQGSFFGNGGCYRRKTFVERSKANYESDLKKACHEIIGIVRNDQNNPPLSIQAVIMMLEGMENFFDDDGLNILDACLFNDVTPTNVAAYLKLAMSSAERELDKKAKKKQNIGKEREMGPVGGMETGDWHGEEWTGHGM